MIDADILAKLMFFVQLFIFSLRILQVDGIRLKNCIVSKSRIWWKNSPTAVSIFHLLCKLIFAKWKPIMADVYMMLWIWGMMERMLVNTGIWWTIVLTPFLARVPDVISERENASFLLECFSKEGAYCKFCFTNANF